MGLSMHPTATDQAAATLFLLDSAGMNEEQWEQQRALFLPRLGIGEAERYVRFTRRQRQRQFLLGRILLRRAVCSLTGVAPNAISVMERPGLAPQLMLADYTGPAPAISPAKRTSALSRPGMPLPFMSRPSP